MKNLFKDRDRASDAFAWTCFWIGLLIIFSVITFPGCKGSMPPIDVTTWRGNSEKDGISRNNGKTVIPCSDPKIDEMFCLSGEDLQEILDVLLQCEKWPSDQVLVKTERVLQHLARKNPEVVNVLKRKRRRAAGMESL